MDTALGLIGDLVGVLPFLISKPSACLESLGEVSSPEVW